MTCGQGDIYASFAGEITPTATLSGPAGWETFLHGMGFTGPNPTWVQQSTSCNDAPVAVPTATKITQCGTYGSVLVPEDTDKIDYTLTGNGTTGINVVTAVAKAPYVLKNYPKGGWTFDLGQYVEPPGQVGAGRGRLVLVADPLRPGEPRRLPEGPPEQLVPREHVAQDLRVLGGGDADAAGVVQPAHPRRFAQAGGPAYSTYDGGVTWGAAIKVVGKSIRPASCARASKLVQMGRPRGKFKPKKLPIWELIINTAAPAVKPTITAWGTRSTHLANPVKATNNCSMATKKLKVMTNCTYCALPTAAKGMTRAAVVSEIALAGPETICLLEPNKAATKHGSIAVYRPY